MHSLRRLLVGAMLAGLLIYLSLSLLPDAGPWVAFAITIAIGFLGALATRSWWGMVTLPVAVIVGRELWSALACAQCSAVGEDTPIVRFLLNLPFFGGATALGAAAGTLLGRWFPRAER
jgi:hypothetical protein